MSSAERDPQPTGEPPSRSASGSPALMAVLSLETPARDLIREVRMMAEGKYFGLPLSEAHARAVVAHIDVLKHSIDELQRLVDDLLHDLVVAERTARHGRES